MWQILDLDFFQTTSPYPVIKPSAQTLTVADPALGIGEFGAVYACTALDDAVPSDEICVKICKEDATVSVQPGWEALKYLALRIAQADRKRKKNQALLLAEIPGLLALPLAIFQGEMDGQRIYGCVLRRLDTEGFSSLETLLEDDALRGQWMSLPVTQRSQALAELAEALCICHEELEFVLTDINPPNIWVDLSGHEGHACFIDLDGGHPIGSRMSTFGKPGDWMAPELTAAVLSGQHPIHLAGIASDLFGLFVTACALLFSAPPFFFLNSLNADIVRHYLAHHAWPAIHSANPDFNAASAEYYDWLLVEWPSLPPAFVFLCKRSLYEGWFNPAHRVSAWEWLVELARTPQIQTFVSDRAATVPGLPITLTWSVCGAQRVSMQINDEPPLAVAPSGSHALGPTHDAVYVLTAEGMLGAKEQAVLAVPVYSTPQIRVLPVAMPLLSGPEISMPAISADTPPLDVTLPDMGSELPMPAYPVGAFAPFPQPDFDALFQRITACVQQSLNTHP